VDIEVTLIDGSRDELLGRAVIPADDLPANFDSATSLEFGEQTWRVLSADPPARDEYVVTGTLRLTLSTAAPTATMPAADMRSIGYSMSSFCDELPVDGDPAAGRSVLSIKDDLWRDLELVGPGHDEAIEANLTAIHRVKTEHASGPGFTACHIRTEPRSPLSGVNFSLAEMAEFFETTLHLVRPVAIDGHGGVARDGFALPIGTGVEIYGCAPFGRVAIAGIHRAGPASGSVCDPLIELMTRHRLSLVDWRGLARIAERDVLAEWLRTEPEWLWR
jgi:hypothetical protein